MLEVLFGLVPLIFVCSAIGLILLNFDAVAQYLIYSVSNLASSKKVYNQIVHQEYIPSDLALIEKKSKVAFNPIKLISTFFTRLFTLIKAIFIPNIDIDIRPTKIAKIQSDNLVQKIASQETNKLQIKSYSSVDEKKDTKYRLSYEPTEHNFFDKIIHNKPTELEEKQNNNTVFALAQKVNQDPMEDPLNMLSLVKAQQEKSVQEDSKRNIFTIEKPYLQDTSEKPVQLNIAQSITKPAIKISTPQIIEAPRESLNKKNSDLVPDQKDPNLEREVFVSKPARPSKISFDIFGVLGKIFIYSILVLPIAITLTTLVIYMLERSSNAVDISYPAWISEQLTSTIENLLNN